MTPTYNSTWFLKFACIKCTCLIHSFFLLQFPLESVTGVEFDDITLRNDVDGSSWFSLSKMVLTVLFKFIFFFCCGFVTGFLYICFNAFNQKIIEIIFQRCHLLSPLFCQPHDIFLLFFNFSFSPELLHPFSWRNPRPHLLQLHSLIFWAFFDISKVQVCSNHYPRAWGEIELLQ